MEHIALPQKKMAKVALVTGSNQGIGLQIVRELCKKFDGVVLLAARSLQRGEEARQVLESEGLHPSVLHLDVDSQQSIQQARDLVKQKYGRLDVLVNNAGVLFRVYMKTLRLITYPLLLHVGLPFTVVNSMGYSSSFILRRNPVVPLIEVPESGKSFYDKAALSIKTNYHAVVNVTQAFSPLLQPNSRVINMSSDWGKIYRIGPRRQREILDPDLTVEKLSSLMDEFVSDAKNLEDYDSKDWAGQADESYAAYAVSKIGVSRLTELQQQTIGSDPSKPGILINSVHPGWIKTRMGTDRATFSVEEGADTPVYLALLPPGTTEPNGKFLVNREAVDWRLTTKP